MRAVSSCGVPLSINLDRVALIRAAVEEVITSMQDFVGEPFLEQKSFFSDSGVTILKDAVAVPNSVIVSEEFNPWSAFGEGCNQQLVSDLQLCQGKVVMLGKASRDTSERWFGPQSAGLPSAGVSVERGGF